ncbi:MAG TPA: TolC family protein [Candidatus Binataceae bacterium]|nr:TolC family protein [Candidatus Binataceae bacterium]
MKALFRWAMAVAMIAAVVLQGRDGWSANSQIESIVAEAVEHNPSVIAAREHYEAQAKMPIQAATLPDPAISFQQLTVGGPKPFEGYETSDFFFTGIGATQEIPWPGKLRLRSDAASRDAEIAKEQLEEARREVAEKVRENCFELFFLGQRLALLMTSRDQLSDIAHFAEDQYRIGKGQQTDLIKAQLAATAMLKEIELARQEIAQRQITLKSILGRDADSRNLEISDLTPTVISAGVDRDRLIELAAQNPTAVRMAEADASKSEISLKLAQEDYIPDFTASYTYQKTGPGFRDYYTLSLGAKIPLYFWRKQKPAVEQAALERESAHERLRGSKLDAIGEIDRDWISIKTQERVMSLYRDGLLPQARASFESAMASYRTGRVDFQTMLSAAVEQLNMSEEYYRAITDREIAIARIEQMIGENL